MPRDAKLPTIELKNDDFPSPQRKKAAEILIEHWDGQTTFKEMATFEDAPSRTTLQNAHDEHFGPPEVDMTVEEIRERYGRVKSYLQTQDRDDGDGTDTPMLPVNTDSMTDREISIFKEGVKLGKQLAEE